MTKNSQIEVINSQINHELSNPEVGRALLATTFKGLNSTSMKQAIMEGMIRGFKFKDFLEKNVYAIPFKDGYSLVTSIDYARKKGMRAGIVGKNAPIYEVDDKKDIVSCTVTVKRRVDGYVGEYSATVYFDEYYKAGRNGYPSLWDSKPRTMIAKVAEMHALRMACPEELSQVYAEEEMHSEAEHADKASATFVPYEVKRVEPKEEAAPAEEKVTEAPAETHDKNAVYSQEEIEELQKDEIKKLMKEKGEYPATNLRIEKVTGLKMQPENYGRIINNLKGINTLSGVGDPVEALGEALRDGE